MTFTVDDHVRKLIHLAARDVFLLLCKNGLIIYPNCKYSCYFVSEKDPSKYKKSGVIIYSVEDKIGMTNYCVNQKLGHNPPVIVIYNFDGNTPLQVDQELQNICNKLLNSIINNDQVPLPQHYFKSIVEDGGAALGIQHGIITQLCEIGAQLYFKCPGLAEAFMCI
jgi:hypothetical protein